MSSAAIDKRLPPSNLTEAYYLPATVITINIKHPPARLGNNPTMMGLTPSPSQGKTPSQHPLLQNLTTKLHSPDPKTLELPHDLQSFQSPLCLPSPSPTQHPL